MRCIYIRVLFTVGIHWDTKRFEFLSAHVKKHMCTAALQCFSQIHCFLAETNI